MLNRIIDVALSGFGHDFSGKFFLIIQQIKILKNLSKKLFLKMKYKKKTKIKIGKFLFKK
jgi:hypothetical protein